MNNLQQLKSYAKQIEATEKLLKVLYDGCGADFKNILKVERVNGAWTINKIVNLMKPSKDEIILIVTDRKCKCYDSHDRRYGFISYTREHVKADNRVSGISAFYTQKEFNEYRKDETCKTIFLLFKKEDIKGNKYERSNGYGRIKRELQELNNINRYTVKNIILGRSLKYNKDYISSADVTNKTFNNTEFIHFDNGYGQVNFNEIPESIDQIFDKSGYYLLEKRRELKRQANILRAKREHEHVCNLDFTNELEQIENNYKKIVSKYIEKLSVTDVFSDNFSNTLKNLENFTRWDFIGFQTKKARILNNEYPNEKTIRNILNSYIECIKKQSI